MLNLIDDYAKDGGEELFTKMHCVLLSNSYRIVEDSQLGRNASWKSPSPPSLAKSPIHITVLVFCYMKHKECLIQSLIIEFPISDTMSLIIEFPISDTMSLEECSH